ncbi:capsular polysaccharide biosynthesis protein [Neokomagataea tanensis NBRC 106556]|uniref:Capsular polysaccharide biosynthesis protein n=1 Tax=Neokomagataea tanensis NBRC 106556 TaxID=1223519 RepID=A0ABQ0QL16_9PROT|nr:capsular polysaccharide biosynthesis protein [Neokomagataea tanensis NBRC 106556]
MDAEAKWLDSVPPAVRPFTARLLDHGRDGERAFYTTEYQYAPNLSELYVFSEIGRTSWRKILASCVEFLELCAQSPGPHPRDTYTQQLVGKKTFDRIERFARETGFDVSRPLSYAGRAMPSLLGLAEQVAPLITFDSSAQTTFMHGDFCFSNILYNSRSSRISVIDPRGYVFDGAHEPYGDLRYDIAKFAHSVDGLYDMILAGRYDMQWDRNYAYDLTFERSSQRTWMQGYFSEMTIGGFAVAADDIRAMTISLFLSMLPLHADRPDRQQAFIANALRLFTALDGASA